MSRDRVRDALELLLHDIRPISLDEPPERMIPTQHRAGDIRQAFAALADATPEGDHVCTVPILPPRKPFVPPTDDDPGDDPQPPDAVREGCWNCCHAPDDCKWGGCGPCSKYCGDPLHKPSGVRSASCSPAHAPSAASQSPDTVRERMLPTSCNLHSDCAAANKKARLAGKHFANHCHDDCCEECFGN